MSYCDTVKFSIVVVVCLLQVKLRQQLQAIENDPMLDNTEKARRKEALILQHSMGAGGLLGVGSRPAYSPVSQPPPQSLGLGMSTILLHAPVFCPPFNTVESVVGQCMVVLHHRVWDWACPQCFPMLQFSVHLEILLSRW